MGQALGQLDGLRVRVGPDGEERELLALSGTGLGQLLATVPRLHHEQAREAVEIAASLIVPDVGALAADDHRHMALAALVDGVAGEVHPEVPLGDRRQAVIAWLGHELRIGGHGSSIDIGLRTRLEESLPARAEAALA